MYNTTVLYQPSQLEKQLGGREEGGRRREFLESSRRAGRLLGWVPSSTIRYLSFYIHTLYCMYSQLADEEMRQCMVVPCPGTFDSLGGHRLRRLRRLRREQPWSAVRVLPVLRAWDGDAGSARVGRRRRGRWSIRQGQIANVGNDFLTNTSCYY
jgi:hypothetical protein